MSEYSLNSVLGSFVNSKKLKFNYTMDSDNVQAIIYDFEKAFGVQDEVELNFVATPTSKFQPKVTIDTYQTTF